MSPPASGPTARSPGFAEKLFRSKLFIWALLVLPGLYPAWPIFTQNPTVLADPLKYLLHHFGFIACVLLAAVLALTPLRVLFPRWGVAQALNRHRRLIGVAAFFYALIHLSCQFLHEAGWPTFFTDIRKPFLFLGMLAFLILLLLAVTSFHFMVRWLGGRRWKNIHRLAYVAAPVAAFHQALGRKLFPVQVVWIFAPLALLEIARIVRQRMKARVSSPPLPTRG